MIKNFSSQGSKSTGSSSYYSVLQSIQEAFQKFQSTKSLKSFDIGTPFTYDNVGDQDVDYLNGCQFSVVEIYKSPLGDSIAQKAINTLYRTQENKKTLNLNFWQLKIIAILGAVATEELFAHHLEIILQGRKGNKNIFLLLSYSESGLEFQTKRYKLQSQKETAKKELYGRRPKNAAIRLISKKVIKGEEIDQFLKKFLNANPQYNVVTNNCQRFVVEFMQTIYGQKI